MGDSIIIVIGIMINVALVIAAARFAWWLFIKIVGGTGKAWRGDEISRVISS